MRCAVIARVGCSEEEYEREPKSEPSFIKAHTAFETARAMCTQCKLVRMSLFMGMCADVSCKLQLASNSNC
jgi:hypothetical protein